MAVGADPANVQVLWGLLLTGSKWYDGAHTTTHIKIKQTMVSYKYGRRNKKMAATKIETIQSAGWGYEDYIVCFASGVCWTGQQ